MPVGRSPPVRANSAPTASPRRTSSRENSRFHSGAAPCANARHSCFCSSFANTSIMWWQGPKPRMVKASRIESVPVRPNPAPITLMDILPFPQLSPAASCRQAIAQALRPAIPRRKSEHIRASCCRCRNQACSWRRTGLRSSPRPADIYSGRRRESESGRISRHRRRAARCARRFTSPSALRRKLTMTKRFLLASDSLASLRNSSTPPVSA